MRKAKGITMVALAITVVVLIFLAFIVIRIAVGEDGIFTLTKSEGNNFKIDQFKDKVYGEMSALVLKLTMDDESLTSEKIIGRFESLKWIGSATIISEEEVQVVSTDHIAVNIIFDPFGGYNLLGQGISNDEPYPTIEFEQLPLNGDPGEKIKIRVTANVKTTKETTGIESIKNVSTGETKEYSKDGVIFEVTSNGEYTFKAISNVGKAKLGKIKVNVISAGVVNVVVDPSTPRNTEKTDTLNGIASGPINVKMTFGEIDAKNTDRFQYRVGENGTWEIVNGNEVQIPITQNIDIFTRFYDGVNYVAGESYSILNVDNVPPSDLQAEVVSATSSSLTVEATATDTASVGAGFDIAKVARFEYSIDNMNWQSSNVLENLAHGRTYAIYVKAIDGAGNQNVTSISGKTETIPGEIAIAAETTTWTQGPVEVEVVWPENAENYEKQYKIGDADVWHTYTGVINVLDNTKVFARLSDGTQGGQETEYEIGWIDKEKPGAPTLEASGNMGNANWYVGNITVAITDGIDSFGEISHSEYSINGSTYTTAENNIITINEDGVHQIAAYTYDKAGNRSETYGEIRVQRDTTGPRIVMNDIEVIEYDESTFMKDVAVENDTSGLDGDVVYTPNTLELGDNEITYTARDKAGNETVAKRIITYKDGIAPNPPTFKTEGTKGNDTWFTSDVTVTIADGTDSLGTVDYTAYTIEGVQEVTEETKGNTVVITADGESKITAYTYDTAGNKSLAGTITVKKDATGPEIEGLTELTINSASYDLEAGVTVKDDLSGMDGTFDYTPKTLEFGENTITYTAKDKAGNVTTETRKVTYKDETAPGAPKLEVEGTEGKEDWYTSDVVVNITAGTDSFGPQDGIYTAYTIAGAQAVAEETKGSTVTIQADGESTITAYTYDAAGNKSTGATITVKKDSTGPKFEGLTDTKITTETYDLTDGVTVADDISGMDGTFDYTPKTLEFGENEITYTAKDKAGNTTTEIRKVTYADEVAPTAPTLTASADPDGNDGWYKKDVTVTMTDGTDSFGTVDYTAYTITGAQAVAEETKGNTITITTDGTSTITAYTYDKAGNKSEAATITIKKDTEGPKFNGLTDTKITTATYNLAEGITVTDEASGVETETSFTFSPETLVLGEENEITYTATDKAGNTTTEKRIVTYKDETAPSAPTLTAGTQATGNDGWYKENVTVTITDGTDSFGTVDYTEYTITGAQETEATKGNTVTITTDGESTITAYTYDEAGNKSEAATLTIKKDTQGPTFEGLTDLTITSATYSLTDGVTVTDSSSGIEATNFTVNPTTLTLFETEEVTYTATDKAGNTTTETRKISYEDTTAPGAPSLAASGTIGTNDWYKSEVIITITNGTDSFGSGEGIYSEYTVSGAETIATTKGNEIVISKEGTSTITAYTYDGEGNKSEKAELEINIDTTGPTFTGLTELTIEEYDETTFTTGVTISDSVSGVTSSTSFTYTPNTLNEGENTITYTATDKAGNTATETRKVTYNPVVYYLVDQVSVGDYVAYKAGTWTQTMEAPTNNATFGGYTEGEDKGTSVIAYINGAGGVFKSDTNGWRVLSKTGSGENGSVTLISAGTPARGYYGSSEVDITEMLLAIDAFSFENFINPTYATSARSVNKGDVESLGESNQLQNINVSYWLASAVEKDVGETVRRMYYVSDDGIIYGGWVNDAFGIRPVVILKTGIKTNKTADETYLGQTCWTLK